MFYEMRHPVDVDYFTVERGENFSFPSHIHYHFEIIMLTEGEMTVSVGNKEYCLTPGKGILVFPNQIHSLVSAGNSRHVLCVFTPKLVNYFFKSKHRTLPQNNIFDLPSYCVEMLTALNETDNISKVKGLLYILCGVFDEQAVYEDVKRDEESRLLHKIFEFIDNHFQDDCSLENLADEVSYSYAYVSKYFKQTVGMSYNSYVNYYRISEVCYRLDNTENSILEISDECGFRSLRSMNRNFKKQMNCTPAEYRKRSEKN
ncbi:MAG: helix-turn-helix transcriptional regulator [Clostridia bacterium]|nr:helix-turn-helix transcriptional regulator [Clostridia bacterium]